MAEDTKQASPAPSGAASSSAEQQAAAGADQKAVKAAGDEAKKAEAADEKEQKARGAAAKKEGGAELADSLKDPATGRQVDSSELGLATARTDLFPRHALAGMSEDEQVKIANRQEDPDKALQALRSGADADEVRAGKY